jgi:hypothetical protein
MAKVSMKSRYEVIGRYKAKYKKSSKKDKGAMLDDICSSTGISRDRAKHILTEHAMTERNSIEKHQTERRGRKPKYDANTAKALEYIWALTDFVSGKRLAAAMGCMLDALIRFDEIDFGDDVIANLREISPASIDRLLKKEKRKMRFKGISTTKPGTLLKKDIPIRLGTQWDDAVPGFVEIDLVAHCGATTAGEYVNTLDVTDVCTGWTETAAVINKAQKHVHEALLRIENLTPFPYMGIDSDNGSEFINAHLYRYCKEHGIVFTRSRPYMKNDGCHVEQKNWSVVRRNIGYDRYEGKEAVRVMNEYYALLRLYTNFFLPSAKLLERNRDGAKVYRRHDTPKTPFQRILASEYISEDIKDDLRKSHASINPAELKRGMIRLLDELLALRVPS